MFLHWGVYSVIGRGEWVKYQEKMPDEEYWRFAPKFRAEHYNPNEWARLARDAGMRYMVLTTKHHDGFCLFRTRTTRLNSLEMGPRRDLIAPYTSACRKHGLKVGLYFSLSDWSKPAFFEGPEGNPAGWKELVAFTHEQVRELMTQYGRIDVLWFDNILEQSGPRPLTAADWDADKLVKMIRRLQPKILINDRTSLAGDFYTAEQHIRPPDDPARLWEACITTNKHWGYFPSDKIWKHPMDLVHTVTAVAYKGGNTLWNVGPRPDGRFPAPAVKLLKVLGDWMKANGESIYGAEICPLDTGTAGVFARRGDTIYLMVHWWPGRTLTLPDFPQELASARILRTGQDVAFHRDGKRLILTGLPVRPPDPWCTVIALKTRRHRKAK